MEANTVRLKEHEQAVLVLEKSPRASTLGSIKYVCLSVISLAHTVCTTLCVSEKCVFFNGVLCILLTLQVHCDIRNAREDS